MLKSIALSALVLCATTFLRVSCTLEKATFTRHLAISTSNSSTVPFNGHLYTVSKNQSHIHINSTDSNYQPCDIAINTERDAIQGPLEITPTDRDIFIVGAKSVVGHRQYTYTILRVDPTACSYESAAIPETNDRRGDYFFPRIVGHSKGTDVFFPSLQKCAPCRLNSVGLRVRGNTPQLPRETSSPGVPFHVRFLAAENKYFYVYSTNNDTASMKLLDAKNFAVLKEKTLEFPVHEVSKQKKSVGFLGVCSKAYDHYMADMDAYTEVRCDSFNNKFDSVVTSRIPIERHSQPISSISYEFDQAANSYVSYAEDTQLRLYIFNAKGELVKAFDLGKIDDKFEDHTVADPEYYDQYDFYDVRGYLVGDEYCITTEQEGTEFKEPFHDVKCIDVKEYNKKHE